MDIFESVFPSENGFPASLDQIENYLLLVFVRRLVKMRFEDKECFDELIYYTLGTA